MELFVQRLLIVAVILVSSIMLVAQQLPDAPSRTKWVVLTTVTATVTALDGWQTSRPGREVGTPWLYGTDPSDHKIKMSVILASEVGVSTVAGRYLQTHRVTIGRVNLQRLWWVPQVFVLAGHTRGIIYNFRVGQY